MAALLVLLLPAFPAAQPRDGCRAEVERLVRAVEQDAAWPQVEAEFTARSGRALVLALRGDEAGCIALLAETRGLLAARGIAAGGAGGGSTTPGGIAPPAPAGASSGASSGASVEVPPATIHVTPSGPGTLWRFGAEEDAAVLRYAPPGTAGREPLELEGRAAAAPAAPVALPAEPILLREVEFGFDQARLPPPAGRVVQEVAEAARALRNPRVLLTGHADTAGPAAYNLRLSQRRVAAVRAALRAAGVPDAAIRTRHLGEARPEVPTADGVRERSNRRVEIRVLDGG